VERGGRATKRSEGGSRLTCGKIEKGRDDKVAIEKGKKEKRGRGDIHFQGKVPEEEGRTGVKFRKCM